MIKTWQDIPGFFDFVDIYNRAVDEAKDGDILVEVGTFLGKSVAYMADRIRASKKDLKLFAVDNWAHPLYARWWETVAGSPVSPTPWPVPELVGMSLHDAFRHSMEVTGSDVSPITESSVTAAGCFEDGSLFFVFLDADHLYEAVRDDIAAWKGKIRPGGILAGHDYRLDPLPQMSNAQSGYPGVAQAVDEQFAGRVEVHHNSWMVRM